MDKQEASRKFDELQATIRRATQEAEELRKVIEAPERIVYDDSKLYVGVDTNGDPFIMHGKSHERNTFCFYSLNGELPTCHGYTSGKATAQECLDYHAECGFKISAFDNVRKGLEFFLKHYKG